MHGPIRSQTHESLCPCSKNLSLRALHNYRITVCIWLVSRINLYLFGELLIKLLLLIFAFRSLTHLGKVYLIEELFLFSSESRLREKIA